MKHEPSAANRSASPPPGRSPGAVEWTEARQPTLRHPVLVEIAAALLLDLIMVLLFA